MNLPALSSLNELDGAHVLVRLDLNVPVADGLIQDDTRIEAALPTIKALLDRGARLALCSHLGKANGSADANYSLWPVAGFLADLLAVACQIKPQHLEVKPYAAGPVSLVQTRLQR